MYTPQSASLPLPADANLGESPVLTAVRAAAKATGVSFDYLLAQASQESGMNPAARNHRSSAAGLFQFTAGTWLDMIRRHGAQVGLGDYAAAIAADKHGRASVADPALRKTILDLRQDPTLSARMAAEYAKDNEKILSAHLGRPISATDLCLAHFLGAAGAIRILEHVDGHAPDEAASLLPQAARANPELFGQSDPRKAASVAALYKAVQSRYIDAVADRPTAAQTEDLAQLRPEPRPDTPPESAPSPVATTVPTPPPGRADASGTATGKPSPTQVQTTTAYPVALPRTDSFPVPIPPAPARAANGDKTES